MKHGNWRFEGGGRERFAQAPRLGSRRGQQRRGRRRKPLRPGVGDAGDTPQLNATGAVEQVRQLVQCGGTMYAVGTFTSVKHNGTVYRREQRLQLQRDRAVQPHHLGPGRQRDRQLDRLQRDELRRCLYRREVHRGRTAPRSPTSPRSAPAAPAPWSRTFGHTANGQVETLLGVNGHILAGGYYTTINGSTANPYMTSLNPTTGKDDGFISLNISGNYQFPGVPATPPGCTTSRSAMAARWTW